MSHTEIEQSSVLNPSKTISNQTQAIEEIIDEDSSSESESESERDSEDEEKKLKFELKTTGDVT